MASYLVSPPSSFNFANPEEWSNWIRRFERFRLASGLNEKSSASQVNTLIYTMGDIADDILSSFGLSEDDKAKYKVVVEKFEAHFVKKRNIIFERAKFNQRRQEENEPVDDFVTSLYRLSEHCRYGELRDELIRDRIVVGLRDSTLSEKLQLDPNLTLEAAITAARQREPSNIDVIVTKKPQTTRSKSTRERANKQPQKSYPASNPQVCGRCGKSHLDKQQCPAKEAICRKCHKRGHFQSVCRTKSLKSVSTEDPVEDFFVGMIDEPAPLVVPTVSSGSDPWMVDVLLNDHLIEFQIDTGADVSVISEDQYQELQVPELKPSDKSLVGPGQDKLQVCGQFTETFSYQNRTVQQDVYVVKGLRKPLIGRPAIMSLKLISQVNTVDVYQRNVVKKFPHLFKGLGTLEGEYEIVLRKDTRPYALATPRRIPLPLKGQVESELKRMETLGVIRRVDVPTDWCAGMVVVPKHNSKVRICVDLTQLNKSVCHERHILPSVEQTLGQLQGAKIFSKLDANSGFWQIKLSPQSALLITFITPIGRFCFNRLPFGITSAPEFYQKKMSHILSGLAGVACMMDDVLVFGATQREHDLRLDAVLDKISKAGVTLNLDKCQFSTDSVKFLGHSIDSAGIHPDPDKIHAIQQLPAPKNITELRRFLGMVTYLGKFISNLSHKVKPLRDLLSSKNEWLWSTSQQEAYTRIKAELSNSPVLALYNPTSDTVVSADASSYGLGAVVMQKQPDHQWKPIAYASRSLTPTEEKYAQIEKEALGITWACERFSEYLVGMCFKVETDHKPLVSLLGAKNLEDLPVRIQRFRMRLMRFTFTISHTPGKDLTIADMLSRAPTFCASKADKQFCQETEMFVNAITTNLPATTQYLSEIARKQDEDESCSQVKQFCKIGWPKQQKIPDSLKSYHLVSAELSVHNNLLLRGSRIVIPLTLQQDMLKKLHEGHQGITKCRLRAKQSMWWPGLNKQLERLVNDCSICCKERVQHAEPLMPTRFPDLPWQKVASDLFVWKGVYYLLVIDYFSRYVEIAKLNGESSTIVIKHLKSIFARHGIPQEMITDNGPQYSSREFGKFAENYGFKHTTSSPRFPQSNGEAERGVQTIKNLLKKSDDPYLALLKYRSTPLPNSNYSPAELLMSRKLRTNLPILNHDLKPKVPSYSKLKTSEYSRREQLKKNFDQRHKAKTLTPLREGVTVWIPDHNCMGKVINKVGPRSYQVKTKFGLLRRNRCHIALPDESANLDDEIDVIPDLLSMRSRDTLLIVSRKCLCSLHAE